MHGQAFGDDVADRHARAERAERVLEHDLHVAAERPHRLELQALDVLAEKHDRAVGRDQPQQRKAERGLAGAGFADDAERLALAHREADAVDRLDMADGRAHQAALDRKPDLQIVGSNHDRRFRPRRRRVGLRLGGEQRRGVGMLRRGEDLFDRPLLDDLAAVHDADRIGDAAHDAEIMGDEQQAHAEPRADIGEQRQDLRLHGDVERRGRLVRDQQIGLVGERHRDHHALPLAAGQLVRIACQAASRDRECRPASRVRGSAPAPPTLLMPLMQLQDLADLRLDRVQRIERGHRLLEDDRDVVAADVAHLVFRQAQQLASLEADAAGGMRRRRIGQQFQDRQRADRFAGAGFADQRDAFAALDLEGDAVDRERRAALLVERHREIADREQGLVDGVHRGPT